MPEPWDEFGILSSDEDEAEVSALFALFKLSPERRKRVIKAASLWDGLWDSCSA